MNKDSTCVFPQEAPRSSQQDSKDFLTGQGKREKEKLDWENSFDAPGVDRVDEKTPNFFNVSLITKGWLPVNAHGAPTGKDEINHSYTEIWDSCLVLVPQTDKIKELFITMRRVGREKKTPNTAEPLQTSVPKPNPETADKRTVI